MKIVLVEAKNSVEEVSKALLNGKVLVVPTDTVYGLLADATSRKAVQKVFLVKGREKGKPLPIFIKDIAMSKTLARVSPLQETYMKKAWPGKVTLVLKSKGKLPKETGTKDTIGLRIPNHKLLQEILSRTKRPLTGTSANLAGKPPLSDGKDVVAVFQKIRHRPDMVLDAGKLSYSRPSRVVDISKNEPRLLRK
tara:strand:+ start:819 stop:1400 length:582 start_codon:yes stop_codon:yes gene_type:complete